MIVDSHAHLNHEDILPGVQDVLARAAAADVGRVVVVGYDAASSARAVELAQLWQELVAAVGLHPYEAGRAGPAEIGRIAALAEDVRVRAIGEIGFDFHGDPAPFEAQAGLVRAQLGIARRRGLPAVLHLRDAGMAIVPLLDEFPDVVPVFHCFSGGAQLLAAGLARGAYISFAGPLTYRANAALRAIAAGVPAERLLVETDSPYLAPQGRRGRTNEPAHVVETLQVLAEAQGTDRARLAAVTAANAFRVFGSW